jgi:hypothetical protein
MTINLSNPQAVAEEGERIYAEKYRTKFESEFLGKFVAIDITSGDAYLGEWSEEAINKGMMTHPSGIFHLIRIGSKGAFSISRINPNARLDGLYGRERFASATHN